MSAHHHHIIPVRSYLFVITALMLLTGLTVWAAFQDFGALNDVVAMGIALVKMMLVVAIFMHLKYSPKILWIFASSALVFLVIMMVFTLGDYMSRAWDRRPEGWERPMDNNAMQPQAAANLQH
jgi:cytochrome c oxidase subunit 4